MCLIAFVPRGLRVPRDIFDFSGKENPDGFGVMSAEEGVRKFFGRKALKRCRRYSRVLSDRQIAHAIHWRWATHGNIDRDNCHPFTTPNGNAHIMHNGVLPDTAKYATADKSDTRLFVDLLDDAPLSVDDSPSPYWGGVQNAIGFSNKFVVLSGSTFYILNEDAGTWIDGVWYSNTYSLPPEYSPASDWDHWNAGMGTASTSYTASEWPHATRDVVSENEEDFAQYRPGARYDVNLGRWRMPEERKRSDFMTPSEFGSAWQQYLARREALPSGPTLETDADYRDIGLMLPLDGETED